MNRESLLGSNFKMSRPTPSVMITSTDSLAQLLSTVASWFKSQSSRTKELKISRAMDQQQSS